MSGLLKPALSLAMKLGGYASAMVGAGMAVDVTKKGIAYASEKGYVPQRVNTVVAGPLDFFGTLLDPLDLFGARKAKQEQQDAKIAALKAAAKDAESQRKLVKRTSDKTDKKAQAALEKAEKLEKEAARKERAGERAKAEAHRNQAEMHRRWATLARRTAASAQMHPDPNQGNAMAAAALEIAKNAMNPPRTAADIVSPDMSSAAKSLVADITDTLNRMTREPDYANLVARMANGQGGGGSFEDELMQQGGDGGYGVEMGDYDEGDVFGADRPVKRRKVAVAGVDVSGPCCSSCAYGMTCGGKGKGLVPDSLISGKFVDPIDSIAFADDVDGSDEDDVDGSDEDYEDYDGHSGYSDEWLAVSGTDLISASVSLSVRESSGYDPTTLRTSAFNALRR